MLKLEGFITFPQSFDHLIFLTSLTSLKLNFVNLYRKMYHSGRGNDIQKSSTSWAICNQTYNEADYAITFYYAHFDTYVNRIVLGALARS